MSAKLLQQQQQGQHLQEREHSCECRAVHGLVPVVGGPNLLLLLLLSGVGLAGQWHALRRRTVVTPTPW
jgi:hypothetical protein